MPIINFEGPQLSREQKAELAAKLTNAANEILPKVPKEAFIVVIQENSMDNVAQGGELLSEKQK